MLEIRLSPWHYGYRSVWGFAKYMKFAFSSNAFRSYSLTETIRVLGEAGYAGIEIMCDVPHAYPRHLSGLDRERIKRDLAEASLEISNLNAFMLCAIQDFHHPSWIEADESYRRLRVEYTLDCIELAVDLGAKSISTEPGGPLDGMGHQEAMDLFVKGLEEVVPVAASKGVALLIEPEPGLLIETSQQFMSLLDRMGTDGVGLNFDIGHFYCVGEDPVSIIKELKDYTVHFHLEDIPLDRSHRHVMLGQGAMDIPRILEAIEATGYQDYVTVELYPYQDTAAEVARQAREYLSRVCGYGC